MPIRRAASTCAALAAAGFVLTYAFFVGTGTGQLLDERLHLPGEGATAWRLLGAYDRWAMVGAVLVLAAVVACTWRRPRRLVSCVALPYVAIGLAEVGKQLLPGPGGAAGTFPSGHVAFAAGTVAALLLAVPPVLRPPVLLVGVPAVGLVIAATVQAEWHRASDGIGSLFLVAALAGVAVRLSTPAVLARVGPTPTPRSEPCASR